MSKDSPPTPMDRLLERLRERKERIARMGGEEAVAKQHGKGKLTARERVGLLFDEGTFTELGGMVTSRHSDFGMRERDTPADGVVTGYGDIAGRRTCCYATDFTILAGSAGESHAAKIAAIIGLAGKMRVPVIGMLDSAGARLHEGSALSRPFNQIFIQQSIYSGVIPQIQVLLGPCAAGQGYSPMLSDFLVMTRKTAYMWLGGPRLTRAATSQDIDDSIVGSAEANMANGQCDLIADDDEHAIALAKRLLAYLPQHCERRPPQLDTDDPSDRRDEELLRVLPDSPRMTYDMHEIVERVVDRDSFLELKDEYAPNIITGFCRLGGRPVGLIANNPEEMGGVMESDCSDKYMRLMTFCDAFNLPIVTLVDTPGFVVGREWESQGILRHGAKLLYGYACATVPKVSVIIRRSYGGGNVVMGSKTVGADFSFAWPTAEISIMGPESAAAIIWADDLKQAEDDDEKKKLLEERCQRYRDTFIDIFSLAENHRYDFVDDIIDPRDTRRVLIDALDALVDKKVEMPARKHGNPPQ